MDKNQLTEYADFLLKAAVRKTQNITEAEDIAQETLIAALAAIEKGTEISEPKVWLSTVLNRKYYDLLRRKYRKPTVSIDAAWDCPADEELTERIERSEDGENIRRCLSRLTRLYREVMVRFYMHGESVKHIASELGIPENTVKSRLDAGRKRVGKEFVMEQYTKQSYEPETLYLSNSGQMSINNEPFSLVGDDKIAQNLLILAYPKPVTVTELAKAIGIGTAYIEPIIDRLTAGELMKRTGDKVYTDFIIYSEQDRTASISLERELADKLYKDIWAVMEKGLEELRGTSYYKYQGGSDEPQRVSQQIKLESYFAVRTLHHAVNDVRDEVCGGHLPFESYPDRPNGGKWFAMGSRYEAGYDWNAAKRYNKYYINGEYGATVGKYQTDSYRGTNCISLHAFSTVLGDSCIANNPIDPQDILKMLFAIYTEREDDLPLINTRCFEYANMFTEKGLLAKHGDRTVCDVPVITGKDQLDLWELGEKYDKMIAEKFHDEFMKLMKDPVKLPSHLKSVPEWHRYLYRCSAFPMMVILNAKENGLFLKGVDAPAPAMVIAVDK